MRGILVRRERQVPDAGAPGARGWLLWFAAACALAAVPVVGVRYPPVLDLPQLLAQIDLAGHSLADPGGPYRIQWWEPDKLGYPLLALARAAGTTWAPRLAVLLVQVAWIAGVFALAARRGRAVESAALATLLLWSGTFYGGFFHFLLGVWALVFWVPELAETRPGRPLARTAAATFAGGILLWLAHALWLAAAAVLVPLALAVRRAPGREWLARALGFAPLVALAVVWYGRLLGQGWYSVLYYGTPVRERLTSPSYLETVVLGGLSGQVEIWLLAVLALWLVAGFAGARGGGVDRPLVLLGLATGAFALLGPELLGAAAMFGRRWGWVAAVCLVLAVPPPRVRPALRTGFVVALLAALSAATFVAWRDFDRRWMSGFERALAPIERGQRVLVLDFVRLVPGLWIHPLFQDGGYVQIERGAEVAYSFAETPSSLVVFRDLPVRRPWTEHLELYPDRLRPQDLDFFDWVLAVAGPDVHAALTARFPRLSERERAGPWRLYAVSAAAPGGAP